jgi:DNA-binding response OmpR family regulator
MKVLLVEDDRKVAGFIEQGLKEEGYVVDAAADGKRRPCWRMSTSMT